MANNFYTLRRAQPENAAFLYQLYSSTRAEEMTAWGWDTTQQNLFLQMQFKAQQSHYATQYPEADHQIILVDGQMAGRILVARSDEEIFLVDIALLPEFRGKGIGTHLLTTLLAEAKETDKTVILQVVKTNPALHLYTRLGFAVTKDDGFYLQMHSQS